MLPPARLSSSWVATGAPDLTNTSRMRGRLGWILLLPIPGMHLFSRLFPHCMLFCFRITGVLNGPLRLIECPRLWRRLWWSRLCGQVSAPATLPQCYLPCRFPNFVCSFRVLMRIVRVQKLRLSRVKGLLSRRYSAPLLLTSWVVEPSTRGLWRPSV